MWPVGGERGLPMMNGKGMRHAGQALLRLSFWGVLAAEPMGGAVHAASLAASSASSAVGSVSTSVGAVSTAVGALSTSSLPGGKPVAQGLYRIEQVQVLQGDMLPLRLAVDLWPAGPQGLEPRQAWQLRVPAATATAAGLQPGQLLEVREQPYGWSVRQSQAPEPFYWVLHDEWAQALRARPLEAAAPPAAAAAPEVLLP